MVPGTDRLLADLNIYTDLSTHYLWGMISFKELFLFIILGIFFLIKFK